MLKISVRNNYSTLPKYSFEELKQLYKEYLISNEIANKNKEKVDAYIYLLYAVTLQGERGAKTSIANALGYTRERIGQIISQVKRGMKQDKSKKIGGDTR